mgnify:CR=1 FL=1
MNASVSVVCYKSKVLSNGKSPLMLRVTKDRKPKYVSLGIAIFPKYWDFEKNKPTPRCLYFLLYVTNLFVILSVNDIN